jgi:hypothetical protein
MLCVRRGGGGGWGVFSVSGKINKGKEENDNKVINLKYCIIIKMITKMIT